MAKPLRVRRQHLYGMLRQLDHDQLVRLGPGTEAVDFSVEDAAWLHRKSEPEICSRRMPQW
jgi:hypothetical protein